ncbi:MAG TPA: MgtC/SapB family protein [Gemmatimonadaceae bacterium]|nr:MgtC/SapB family protein [Gemmatimonadaceae bacterium]
MPLFMDETVARLLVAALSGLAVGLEREWSGHASGPLARFAGLRTFLLIGGLGGVSGWLADSGSTAAATVLLAAASALIVAAYVVAARPGGHTVEATTEVAALLVLALGVLAGLGFLELASGATAIMVLALSEKERLREFVTRIGERELRAGLQFAVLALVVLPLLPPGRYGPLGGIEPRGLWIIVLLFSALNFAGYLARRAVGAERGYGVTGLMGGLVSSTAVTFQFSRLSRSDPSLGTGLAVGVLGASTVLLPRVLIVSTILNADVGRALVPFVIPPFVVGAAMLLFAVARRWEPAQVAKQADELQNPLRLSSAIKMALAFQASLMLISYVSSTIGASGVLASAALLGLTDMDALTLSMSRLGTTPDLVRLSARAIAIGLLGNAALKIALVIGLGASRYRWLAAMGLGALAVTGAIVLAVFW